MAYMRGDTYVYRSGDDDIHIWVREGYDGWDESLWAMDSDGHRHPGFENASGIGMPIDDFDELVVARLVQIIASGTLETTVQRAIDKYRGNFGMRALVQNADALISALAPVRFTDEQADGQ